MLLTTRSATGSSQEYEANYHEVLETGQALCLVGTDYHAAGYEKPTHGKPPDKVVDMVAKENDGLKIKVNKEVGECETEAGYDKPSSVLLDKGVDASAAPTLKKTAPEEQQHQLDAGEDINPVLKLICHAERADTPHPILPNDLHQQTPQCQELGDGEAEPEKPPHIGEHTAHKWVPQQTMENPQILLELAGDITSTQGIGEETADNPHDNVKAEIKDVELEGHSASGFLQDRISQHRNNCTLAEKGQSETHIAHMNEPPATAHLFNFASSIHISLHG